MLQNKKNIMPEKKDGFNFFYMYNRPHLFFATFRINTFFS